jgi:hypothetical protein
MSKRPEMIVKHKVERASMRLETSIDEAASGVRHKGAELRKYLKKMNADVEEWKFGVEESKQGYRVEWKMVALFRMPKKRN